MIVVLERGGIRTGDRINVQKQQKSTDRHERRRGFNCIPASSHLPGILSISRETFSVGIRASSTIPLVSGEDLAFPRLSRCMSARFLRKAALSFSVMRPICMAGKPNCLTSTGSAERYRIRAFTAVQRSDIGRKNNRHMRCRPVMIRYVLSSRNLNGPLRPGRQQCCTMETLFWVAEPSYRGKLDLPTAVIV